MLNDVNEVISDETGKYVAPDQPIGSVVTDSLEFVELWMKLEERFDIRFPNRDMTPLEICSYIRDNK